MHERIPDHPRWKNKSGSRERIPDHPRWNRRPTSSYDRGHYKLHNIRGAANQCAWGCTADRYYWANLMGDYDNPDDYAPMCALCHKRFDMAQSSILGTVTSPTGKNAPDLTFLSSANTSGYRGVSWHKSRNQWSAYIGIDGHQQHLGLFDNPVLAAFVVDDAARKHFGNFAVTNFQFTPDNTMPRVWEETPTH